MIEIHNVDAFDYLPTLPAESFDAIVTDPPYSSGGKDVQRRKGDGVNKYLKGCSMEFDDGTRDQLAHYSWTLQWLRACRRVLKDGGWLMVFTDWRQLPLMCTAVQVAGYCWQGVNTWHKPNSRPMLGRFFRGDEFIVMASKGRIDTTGQPRKSYAQQWAGMLSPKERHHATSKPVDLMRHLLQAVRPGGRVLDPFAGGGSTLVAAESMGLDSVGLEVTIDNYARLRARVDAMTQ